MKAITLRNLPEMVADAVQAKAEKEHLSISKAILALLEEHVAESHGHQRGKKKRDLSWIAGTMTEEDAKIFDEAVKEFSRIDPEMWK